MYKTGYQEFEQRDSADAVVKPGVVSKKNAFCNAENTGIYDAIAENFRAIAERLSSVEDNAVIKSIHDDIEKMYNDMRTNVNFGSIEASAQAKIATDEAAAAMQSAKDALNTLTEVKTNKAAMDSVIADVSKSLDTIKSYIATVEDTEKKVSDTAQVATNQAKLATEQAAVAKQTNDATATAVEQAHKWADGTDSPDGAADTDSSTGKTLSAKGWTLDLKAKLSIILATQEAAERAQKASALSATQALTSETNAKTSADAAAASASSSRDHERGAQSILLSVQNEKSQVEGDIGKIQAGVSDAKGHLDDINAAMTKYKAFEDAFAEIKKEMNDTDQQTKDCLADAKSIRDSVSSAVVYKGSKDNFTDLPTREQKVGDMWNITNADKTNNIKAGDNVVWNGSAWDNMGGFIDDSLFAKIGSDTSFSTVTATTFTGALNGNAKTATTADTAKAVTWDNVTGKPTAMPANGGTADVAKLANTVDWTNVAGRPTSMPANGGTADIANAVAWANITGKPTAMPASGGTADLAKAVAWANVTDKPAAMPANGGTADVAKTANAVAWANVTGKPTAMPANGGTADTAKSVPWANITGAPTSMPANGGTADTANSVAWGNVTGAPTSMAANGGNADTASKAYTAVSDPDGYTLFGIRNTSAGHNSVYRGKDITANFNNGSMSRAIAAGTFDDIFPGDYIVKTFKFGDLTYANVKWYVMDCDYFYEAAGFSTSKHHVVIMPDCSFGKHKMNDGNTTAGGYVGSWMWKEAMPYLNGYIQSTFGTNHVLTHQELLSSNINASAPSAGGAGVNGTASDSTWVNVLCNIPNEQMVFGQSIFSSSFFDIGSRSFQLAAIRHNKEIGFIPNEFYWLSSISSASTYVTAAFQLAAWSNPTSSEMSLRPYFLLY